jgi:hypothetical protein
MMQRATSVSPSHVEGRFVVTCRWQKRNWHVVVEPESATLKLIVVTASAEDST